ncbi:MAG: type 1 glutamine amidotransferase domain-containing protein [Flaviflexus sp.]|nr:type 1 glutamine amidotransferase domain-containing protein [Flaviflexus sp.]
MLSGRKIAFLALRGVEEPELTAPWKAVLDAGGVPVLISAEPGTITALRGDWDRGEDFTVDETLADAQPSEYAGVVLPGGTLNSDKLRDNEDAQAFVSAFFAADKPVATICHGAWILTEIGVLPGRTITSVARIATDLKGAGATWVDEEFVRDGNLASSRHPRDLEAFCHGIVPLFAE